MKTIASHRRRGLLTHRAGHTHRQTCQGNGHSSTGQPSPEISAKMAAWLAGAKHNLIGGKWMPAASGKTFSVLNPADTSQLARVPDSDREDEVGKLATATTKLKDQLAAAERSKL